MDFDEAYYLYLSYCTYGEASVKDCDQKKRFKELLLHPEFGLCVYIVSLKEKQYIVLRADEIDLDDFFLDLSANDKCEKSSRFILDRDSVKALSIALDTEWDKALQDQGWNWMILVLTVILFAKMNSVFLNT